VLIITLVEVYNSKFFPFQDKSIDSGLRIRQFLIVMFHSLSLFIFGLGVVLLLTEIGKRWCGRLRPCIYIYN